MQKKYSLSLTYTHTFWILSAAIVFMIFLYGYFVNTTILYTASRQDVEDKIIDTKTDISQLELALIESQRTITQAHAEAVGLSAVTELVFVERDAIRSLSLNDIQP